MWLEERATQVCMPRDMSLRIWNWRSICIVFHLLCQRIWKADSDLASLAFLGWSPTKYLSCLNCLHSLLIPVLFLVPSYAIYTSRCSSYFWCCIPPNWSSLCHLIGILWTAISNQPFNSAFQECFGAWTCSFHGACTNALSKVCAKVFGIWMCEGFPYVEGLQKLLPQKIYPYRPLRMIEYSHPSQSLRLFQGLRYWQAG